MMSKKVNVISLFFFYIVLMAMLLNYVEKVLIWQLGFLALFFITFLCSRRFRIALVDDIKEILILFVLISLSLFCANSNNAVFANLMGVVVPCIACLSLVAIMKTSKLNSEKLLVSCARIINCWWIINIITLLIQISGYPIFLKQKWIASSPMYEDLCCGLFGQNRTHELVFYSCLVYSCNMRLCEIHNRNENRKGARRLLIYTIVSEALMLIISTRNDNTAMFLFLPVFMLLRGVIKDYKKATDVIKKYFKYIIAFITIIVAIRLSLFVPSIKAVFEDYLYRRFYDMLNYNTVGVAGSNERLAIVEYALSIKESYFFGQGFGTEIFGEHIAHGFKHFGLSSIGSTIYIAGIWYYLMQLITYYKAFVCGMAQKSNNIIKALTFILIFALSVYSPIFISFSSMIFLTLYFVYI